MPYTPPPPRNNAAYRRTQAERFSHVDGTGNTYVPFQESSGPSGQADVDEQSLKDHHQLGCSCTWPEAPIVGTCDTCLEAGEPADVCDRHFVVCPCGAACCWRHSHPIGRSRRRQCTRCHLKEKNKAFFGKVGKGLRTMARKIFFTS